MSKVIVKICTIDKLKWRFETIQVESVGIRMPVYSLDSRNLCDVVKHTLWPVVISINGFNLITSREYGDVANISFELAYKCNFHVREF